MGDWAGNGNGWLDEDGGDPRAKYQRKRGAGEKKGEEYGVPYVCVECPACGSREVPVYKTAHPVRYHACRGCGKRFKSIDVAAQETGK